jgi:alcohol dehydrogenase class IV
MNRFKNASNIFFGHDSALSLSDFLLENGLQNPLAVIDDNLKTSEYVGRILDACSIKREASLEYVSLKFEPSYEFLDETYKKIQNKYFDCIVGIGGGSVCDLVKGLSILTANPGPSLQYRGLNKVKCPGKPAILIPSTAGTGSEATKTASFIDRKENKKLGINGNHVDTLFAVLDPKIVMTCPSSVKISAGLDALLHAIEAMTARSATILSKIQGAQAFKLLFDNFPLIMNSAAHEEAYLNMLLGSHLAGVAMFNAGGGPASGLSYPLGVHYQVPHGIAGGIFLQHVFEYNVSRGYDGYDDLYVILTNDIREKHKGRSFVLLFKEFYEKIGKDEISKLIRLTMEQRIENLRLNPVDFGEDDVRDLLQKVLD